MSRGGEGRAGVAAAAAGVRRESARFLALTFFQRGASLHARTAHTTRTLPPHPISSMSDGRGGVPLAGGPAAGDEVYAGADDLAPSIDVGAAGDDDGDEREAALAR